jgi:hypothetical protein
MDVVAVPLIPTQSNLCELETKVYASQDLGRDPSQPNFLARAVSLRLNVSKLIGPLYIPQVLTAAATFLQLTTGKDLRSGSKKSLSFSSLLFFY